jgi:hypothetical protein
MGRLAMDDGRRTTDRCKSVRWSVPICSVCAFAEPFAFSSFCLECLKIDFSKIDFSLIETLKIDFL